ncbi:MAG: penicillin-binding protein 2 [Candidatus Peregrinibacteria bacterium]
MRHLGPKVTINKITFLLVGSAFITALLIIRLFQLQVLAHDYYQDLATKEQYGYIDLPAQRGEIIIRDYHSNEEFLLATNTTLNLVYADPSLIDDPLYVADSLAPLLFNLEEARAADEERLKDLNATTPPPAETPTGDATEIASTPPEDLAQLTRPLSDEELETKFKSDLVKSLSQKRRPEILLTSDVPEESLTKLKSLSIPGIAVIENRVYAYPPQISDTASVAEKIADYVEIPSAKLKTLLRGENRYVILKRKLSPEISDQITELIKNDKDEKFAGIGMQEEYFRYYPESSLAANIIGYVSRDNIGQYGIESAFNTQLQGIAGKFQTKKDSVGRQITVGESSLTPAVDGDDIVLTIDRSIQLKVEQILAQDVEYYRATSGQVIVMDPKTGKIIAMAHYPSFNPNNYGDVFKKVEVVFTPEELKNLYPTSEEDVYNFYVNAVTLDKYPIFEEKDENGKIRYYRYENFVGPEVYHNKIVSWPYESGSVFKTIAMAIGIDDGDITPNTTYNDTGPVKVDWNPYTESYDFEIKNATDYFGLVDMTTVLAKSLNTGMTFVAKRIGPALFYSYLEKFGFLDRTDIEFDSETIGKIEYWEDWSESELATHAFGQGLTVTMIQLANAYSAIINGGVLMQPHIVDEIRHDDGVVTKTEPREIRRVISEDTSSKMTAMLVYSAENGEAKKGQVAGHYVGGKTGTSQTYKHGQALSGTGTTIASFAGYGPVEDPQFVILIKLDYPRENQWGSNTAAVTFSKIAGYLFDYYNIPPDK